MQKVVNFSLVSQWSTEFTIWSIGQWCLLNRNDTPDLVGLNEMDVVRKNILAQLI